MQLQYRFGSSHRGWLKVINHSSGVEYNLYSLDFEDASFFIIEAIDRVTIEEFQNFCWACQVAYGYITGALIADEEFSFYYGNENMDKVLGWQYNQISPSLQSIDNLYL